MSETQTTAGETGPATYDETFRTLCIALGWAYMPDAGFESVAIAAEAAARDLLWQKSQRAEAGQTLQRVTNERDALRDALKDLVQADTDQADPGLQYLALEKARVALSRMEGAPARAR